MREEAVNEVEAVTATNQNRNRLNPSRHSLKCVICNHPDRAAIEFDFLNWRNPGDLVKGYRFRGLSTIYRHAHATGLFAKRRLNLRFAMERIVERVNEVPVTANSVIRAARAVARINDSGEWIDPPSRLIVTHINSDEPAESHAENGSCSGRSNSVRAGTSLVGRGGTCPDRSVGNRDKKIRSSRSSSRARQAGQGEIPDIAARDASASLATSHSPLATVFDEILLDEPSDSASCELPRINGKPPDPEIVLEISPSLYGAVQARREAANVRLAPWRSPPPGSAARAPAAGENGSISREQEVASPASSLPEAASPPQRAFCASASRSSRKQCRGH